jgi:DNA-nicking Smr family endonuclease
VTDSKNNYPVNQSSPGPPLGGPHDESDEVVVHPIEDFLDLHTFRPQEVKDLLDDYLEMAHEKGFREVRIIHGKGTGILRQRVHSILKKHPLVISFRQTDDQGGAWGATTVHLRTI